jgi:branched-subunit amino acid transport protein
MTYALVGSVAATCFALRAAVPLLLRRRGLPASIESRLGAAVPALLAALAATQLLSTGGRVSVDWRLPTVALGAGVYLWRRSLPLAMLLAAAATAGARLLFG